MAYKNPKPTVDIIIQHEGVQNSIVLVRRKNPPLGWALPGGFVDEGERVETAAIREAKEETDLHVTLNELLYVYSDPSRDLRMHTLSVVFTATAQGEPRGLDDAVEAKVFSVHDLPSPIVFDHAQIIADYVRFMSTGLRPRP
jgi:8-oxo-dGTP diphosphatase